MYNRYVNLCVYIRRHYWPSQFHFKIRSKTRRPAVAGMADSWRQINLIGGEGHGLQLGVRSVQWQAWFPFSGMRRHMRFSVTWSWYIQPREGHPMQSLCMTLKWPVKVNQGKSSRCTFINWAMVNIVVYMHSWPRSNREDATGQFHFRDLEVTSSRSSKVNLFAYSERPISTSQ